MPIKTSGIFKPVVTNQAIKHATSGKTNHALIRMVRLQHACMYIVLVMLMLTRMLESACNIVILHTCIGTYLCMYMYFITKMFQLVINVQLVKQLMLVKTEYASTTLLLYCSTVSTCSFILLLTTSVIAYKK